MALDSKTLRNNLITRRTFLIGAGQSSFFCLLFARLFYMQMFRQNEYKILSEKNRISLIVTPPIRGLIYDRTGMLLAINKLCFRLLLDKAINPNYKEEIIKLQKILDLSNEETESILIKVKKANIKLPVLVLDQIDWSKIAIIEENKPFLSSIFIDKSEYRFYPEGSNFAHLVGYMGKDNKGKQNLLINKYDFNIGLTGVEKYYEKDLQGEVGFKQMEVNAYGKYIKTLTQIDSKEGQNLILNIDVDLQNSIYPYLSSQGASAIVMDVKTGQILIMASSPTFDPNNFNRLSKKYWNDLISDQYRPLINKTIHSCYPPGSIFKIVTILAALKAGILPTKKIRCSGASMLGGKYFKCHAKNGHGDIDMENAIKYSCNSYMYEVARLIGVNEILEVAKAFCLGSATGIDLPAEASGFLPTQSWKEEKHHDKWRLSDTMNISIGQGFLLVTPMQLVRFIGGVASGILVTPTLAQNRVSKKLEIDIPLQHLEIIKYAMYQAVNTPGGTAYYSRIINPAWQLAGKTGTCQVQSKLNANDDLSRESLEWKRRNHAVFAGFAPFDNPKYSILVFIDHGGGGGRAAAPIASKIMEQVLTKYA